MIEIRYLPGGYDKLGQRVSGQRSRAQAGAFGRTAMLAGAPSAAIGSAPPHAAAGTVHSLERWGDPDARRIQLDCASPA